MLSFYSVATVSPSVAVAVVTVDARNHGRILRTEDIGATWDLVGSGTDEVYYDIQFIDSKYGWIVGDPGIVLLYESYEL